MPEKFIRPFLEDPCGPSVMEGVAQGGVAGTPDEEISLQDPIFYGTIPVQVRGIGETRSQAQQGDRCGEEFCHRGGEEKLLLVASEVYSLSVEGSY